MGKALRSKWGLLALVAAMVVGMATIPAVGEHSPESSEILRLHMGEDGNYFQLDGADPKGFAPSNNCSLDVVNDWITLSGSSSPGYHNQSIGVRGRGGNGVPCSRVDSSESLTLTLKGGRTAVAVDLDLELKGDVEAYITLSHGEQYTVRSGSKAQGDPGTDSLDLSSTVRIGNCQSGPDSGPDSGANDNCRVTIDPDIAFTSLTFSLTSGEMSLEGGGDFYPYDPANDTIFYLETWDGTLVCPESPEGDTSTDEERDPVEESQVIVQIFRHANADGSDCDPKLYRLTPDAEDEDNGSVVFEVSDPESQLAFFEAKVTFFENLETDPPMQGTLEYDWDGSDGYNDWQTMPACLSDPLPEGEPINPQAVPGFPEDVTQAALDAWVADDENARGCVISVTQNYTGETIWHAVFMGDWKFR